MPDKKLTDNEIIKALECCSTYYDVSGCKNCPLDGKCEPNMLEQYVLDLINRLQAENEELKATVKVLRFGVEQAHLIRKDGKSPFNLLKAEIKAEAYKEFAERLKRTFPKDDFLRSTKRISEDIDNLLNELVGNGDE